MTIIISGDKWHTTEQLTLSEGSLETKDLKVII